MIGNYALKENGRFRCGTTSFEIEAGHIVRVKQVDSSVRKVLIDFGGNTVDWYSDTILAKFNRVS